MHATPTKLLPVSSLVDGPNVRTGSFKTDDLEKSFSDGVGLQLHPVTVRRLEAGRERYEVIAGHRRVAAARALGWHHVEAKIVEVDPQGARLLGLEENLRRAALKNEPQALAELARLYRQQARQRGGTPAHRRQVDGEATQRLAKATGQSLRETQRKVRIGRHGSIKLKAALAEGRLNVLQAEKLVALPPHEQDQQLELLVTKKTSTLDRVRAAIEYLRRVVPELEADERRVVRAEVEELLFSFGAAKISKKTKAAKAAGDVRGAVEIDLKSANRKLSSVGMSPGKERPHFVPMKPFVVTTSVSITATCPDSCRFKNTPGHAGQCYADAGFSRIKGARLDKAARGVAALDVIREEVRRLDATFPKGVPQDGARGGRDLRLHVAGEVSCEEGAELLAGAATRWRQRHGGDVFSYTHRWAAIPRTAWGPDISVLASIESPRDALIARQQGYVPALVVKKFPSNSDKAFKTSGMKFVPCPAQTRSGTTCASCRLCFDDRALFKRKTGVAFAEH